MLNAKTLKRLRKVIRETFHDWPKVSYLTTPGRVITVTDYARGIQLNGLPYTFPFQITGTTKLIDKCQRGVYRALKKTA